MIPKTSMEFVALFNLPLSANIIDIGGGDSHFVDALLDKSYQNIYVLDTIENNLDISTIQVLSYSSKAFIQVLPGRIVRFNFPNIFL